MSILRREATHTDDHSDLLTHDWRAALQELKQDVLAVGKAVKARSFNLAQASNDISYDLKVLACKMRKLDDDDPMGKGDSYTNTTYIIKEVTRWANQLKNVKAAKSIGVMMLNWAGANDSEEKRKMVNEELCIQNGVYMFHPVYGKLRY
tara:strand:- start:3681 stop:4127 length:447 start_codon:yes stop_codon:yes gene_type:complete